jgi:hypothetical protein
MGSTRDGNRGDCARRASRTRGSLTQLTPQSSLGAFQNQPANITLIQVEILRKLAPQVDASPGHSTNWAQQRVETGSLASASATDPRMDSAVLRKPRCSSSSLKRARDCHTSLAFVTHSNRTPLEVKSRAAEEPTARACTADESINNRPV